MAPLDLSSWISFLMGDGAMRELNWPLVLVVVAAAAILMTVFAGQAYSQGGLPAVGQSVAPPTPLTVAPPPAPAGGGRAVPASMGQLQLSFAEVVRKTAPAVVNIYARKIVRRPPMFDDPFFRRFYGIPDQQGPSTRKVPSSLGSGVIVRGDGIVITNNHVIAEADEIMVVTNDRREFAAKVLLADDKTDLAVLKIDPAGRTLPSLRFADSDTAQVGDIVLAIGNPFGVGQTVTSGIISALARTQVGVSDYQFFIQTDAAINPGNSGGALVTMDGSLIGINTAIFSRSGGSIGIGFAIPANMVKLVSTTAEGGKKLQRPWVGLTPKVVTNDVADSLGLDRPQGVLVQSLAANGPAARAGLREGDVVTKVDGQEVSDPEALRYRLATKGVGSTAQLSYLRDGSSGVATVALTKAPDTPPRNIQDIDGPNPLNGAVVGNLNPAFAEELGMEAQQGVVIVQVNRRSLAARVGLRPEDIVVRINGRKIDSVDVLLEQVRQRPRGWELVVDRKGRELSVRLPPVR